MPWSRNVHTPMHSSHSSYLVLRDEFFSPFLFIPARSAPPKGSLSSFSLNFSPVSRDAKQIHLSCASYKLYREEGTCINNQIFTTREIIQSQDLQVCKFFGKSKFEMEWKKGIMIGAIHLSASKTIVKYQFESPDF